MNRLSLMIPCVLLLCLLTACNGEQTGGNGSVQNTAPGTVSSADAEPENRPEASAVSQTGQADQADQAERKEGSEVADEIKVKITVGETELTAVFEDNTTSRALVEQMPMTLPMMDLYGREMCYRYGGGTFETDALRYDRYEVGDIAYWPPAGSLVILYKQNDEEFERQQIGHIDDGVDVFIGIGDVDVTFELIED